MPSRFQLQCLLAAVALAVVAVGCGGGTGDRTTGAQPSPGVTTFEPGIFDEIPRPPGSEPLSERNEKDGVIAQSFSARDVRPSGVLEFYENRLEGTWALVSQPQEIGVDTYRGTWARDNWILTVSATPAQTVDADPPAAQGTYFSQYSLSLARRPAG